MSDKHEILLLGTLKAPPQRHQTACERAGIRASINTGPARERSKLGRLNHCKKDAEIDAVLVGQQACSSGARRLVPFEELDVAFVFLSLRACGKRAEVAALARRRVHFPRIEPVLAGLEFSDHGYLCRSGS